MFKELIILVNNVALKRICAYLIDYIVITLICSALIYIPFINPRYEGYMETSDQYNEVLQAYASGEIDVNEATEQINDLRYELNSNGYVYIIGEIIITFLYYGVFVYFTHGQTLGKRILGIKIVSNKGKKLGLHNYFIRTFILNGVISSIIVLIAICFKESTFITMCDVASSINTILMIIIFLMILFWREGRGLHDILAGTKVIDVRNEEAVEESLEEVKVIKPKKVSKKKDED